MNLSFSLTKADNEIKLNLEHLLQFGDNILVEVKKG